MYKCVLCGSNNNEIMRYVVIDCPDSKAIWIEMTYLHNIQLGGILCHRYGCGLNPGEVIPTCVGLL